MSWQKNNFQQKYLNNKKYKIIKTLWFWSFGVTLKALQYVGDISLWEVVVKFPINTKKHESTLKFIEEAVALRKVNHPNLIKLHDIFVKDWIPYLVMENVSWKTLYSLMNTNWKNNLSFERIFHIMAQLGDAISDLHPNNIIVIPWLDMNYRPDFVKILDFWLVTLWKNKGQWCLGFAAPEQIYDTPKPINDLYSLGVILYLLLTWDLPYKPELSLDEKKWINSTLPDLPDNFPSEINHFVKKCIEPKIENRYWGLPWFVSSCINFRQIYAKNMII